MKMTNIDTNQNEDRRALFGLLSRLKLPFRRFDHEAVFTCEESEGLDSPIPGAHTKQLLLKGKRTGTVVMAIVMHDKRVDTKALAKECGDQSFSFASPVILSELLHVMPGSVTPFGLIFDKHNVVNVIIDEDAWNIGQFRFHPLVNTATLTIDRTSFETFLRHTGHAFKIQHIPQKQQ